jgi:hypothetical protein
MDFATASAENWKSKVCESAAGNSVPERIGVEMTFPL